MLIINQRKFELLLKDYYANFKGWDFSYIETTHRIQEYPLNWSYRSIAINYLLNSNILLDMGTGGGEFLSSLAPLPISTFATESYKPNIELAKKRLKPLGVKVIEIDDSGKLPFKDNFFDLIINRHEFYDPDEAYRILNTNGHLITQQVGDQNEIEINIWLDSKMDDSEWNLEKASKDLLTSNFTILDSKEIITKTRFYDIGAVLFYLKAIPWQIPDFSIEKYYSRIVDLHNKIESTGFFDSTCHRFIIIAKK
jgi:SAM-dependent methyltransferase